MLKAWIRSLSLPHFGTVTVHGYGKVVPSVLKTVTVIVRIVVEGSGSDRYMNGSNVTDTFLQTGQTNIDRNWPYKISKKKKNGINQGDRLPHILKAMKDQFFTEASNNNWEFFRT